MNFSLTRTKTGFVRLNFAFNFWQSLLSKMPSFSIIIKIRQQYWHNKAKHALSSASRKSKLKEDEHTLYFIIKNRQIDRSCAWIILYHQNSSKQHWHTSSMYYPSSSKNAKLREVTHTLSFLNQQAPILTKAVHAFYIIF